MIEELPRLLSGLAFGLVFGFLLQKGRVAKFGVIVRQFLLRDWTVAKIMGTAILVGAAGIYAMLPAGLVSLHVKPLMLGGVLIGGAFFGVGIALLGYCPGTCVAACGEGRRDAMVGVAGGIAGSAVFVVGYALLHPLQQLGDFGELTVAGATGSSPWLWIVGASAAAIAVGVALRGRRAVGGSRHDRRDHHHTRPGAVDPLTT